MLRKRNKQMSSNKTNNQSQTLQQNHLPGSAADLLAEEYKSLQRIYQMTQERLTAEESLTLSDIAVLLTVREEEIRWIKTLESRKQNFPVNKDDHQDLLQNIRGLTKELNDMDTELYEHMRLEKMKLAKDLTKVADIRSNGASKMTLTEDGTREHLIDIQQK